MGKRVCGPAPTTQMKRVLAAASLGGVAGALASTEAVRSSRPYWFLVDRVGTPLLRRIPDAELAHSITVTLLEYGFGPIDPKRGVASQLLKTSAFGLSFPSPLGLAAGFDKQATCFNALIDMGFAFVEVGGVTPLPQPGNAKHRMFRLEEDKAVINRFGLNSQGHEAVAARLMEHPPLVGNVGVNLAKNSASTDLVGDYVKGVASFGRCCDFLVLNVSCPNVSYTKDMKDDDLKNLVAAVAKERNATCKDTPLLLKVSPDMNLEQQKAIASLAISLGVDGLVVSNTTTSRPSTLQSQSKHETGGLSGQPVKQLALATTKSLFQLTNGTVPIIGVGGIATGADAYERIRAGATLVEIYTALAYEGPGLVLAIKDELERLVQKDGFSHVSQCIGVDANK